MDVGKYRKLRYDKMVGKHWLSVHTVHFLDNILQPTKEGKLWAILHRSDVIRKIRLGLGDENVIRSDRNDISYQSTSRVRGDGGVSDR